MLVGEGLTFYLLPPAQVRREDNTTVAPSTRTDTTSNLTIFGHIVKRELNNLLAIQQEKRRVSVIPDTCLELIPKGGISRPDVLHGQLLLFIPAERDQRSLF